eukprot:m.33291 g.33291  ORF g.33291 m.33291 type:complete len:184 (+) comp9605_c0_seq1:99-650(+)
MDELTAAAASGSLKEIDARISEGRDVNGADAQGHSPLVTAAFWGHDRAVAHLLEKGASINQQSVCNGWTAAHAAAVQGHGKVLFVLLSHNPDLTLKCSKGCTAGDYASPQDAVWPQFAAAGVQRTGKAELVQKGIIFKAKTSGDAAEDVATHFTRPGSAYRVAPQPFVPMRGPRGGDVLLEDD